MQPLDNFAMQSQDELEELCMREALPLDEIETAADLACDAAPTYTIQAGDTYEGVAQAMSITVLELFELNPYFDASKMTPGQTLRIPGARLL